MEAQAIIIIPFTICSSCKRKFGICQFVGEETNGSYLFANGLNGLNELAIYAFQSPLVTGEISQC
jgi:hypothetical protein